MDDTVHVGISTAIRIQKGGVHLASAKPIHEMVA